MKILLIHQNFPGQFLNLVERLADDQENEVVVLTMNGFPDQDNLRIIKYSQSKIDAESVHPWLDDIRKEISHGAGALKAAIELKENGFIPDVILSHPGWGDSLFLKYAWPEAKLISYCEFYYKFNGLDLGFDPEFPHNGVSDYCRVKVKNANNLLSLEESDALISPTNFQKSTYPKTYQSMIEVIHDGIDTEKLYPFPQAEIKIGSQHFTCADEIVTFVNRNLEPCRGYHSFIRALPQILSEKPNAHIMIVGGDLPGYGINPPEGTSWKMHFLKEVQDSVDHSRLHFLGNIPYTTFVTLLQVSTVHVYLSYPFVLSWSLLEAMACGCAVIGSDTAPVKEVIEHGENGLLVDFFSSREIATQVVRLIEDFDLRKRLGIAARDSIVKKYDFNRVCLPKILDFIHRTVYSA